MTPDSLTNRLHDIQELDPAGLWPLATGWWLLIAAAVLLVLLVISLRRSNYDWRRYLPRHGWSRDAARELTRLREQVGRKDDKDLAARLSELMRRIAIARCGREHCAGLHGESWLAWLADHDPEGFDWRDHGRLLLDMPYAPPGTTADRLDMRHLINAALAWTGQTGRCVQAQESGRGL